MDKAKVVSELQQRYPGKSIICLPESNPTEILCEIDPTSIHPDYSVAISVIDKSSEHVHKITTEEYEIVKGVLTLYIDNDKHILNQGDKIIIKPDQKHWAEGKETWIKATSHPGWTPEDHLLQ